MNNFEKKIKDRINKYKSDIDPIEIWEGIQNKRYPKKRKRRFAFLMLAASILLLLSISVALYTLTNTKESINNSTIVELKESGSKKANSNINKEQDNLDNKITKYETSDFNNLTEIKIERTILNVSSKKNKIAHKKTSNIIAYQAINYNELNSVHIVENEFVNKDKDNRNINIAPLKLNTFFLENTIYLQCKIFPFTYNLKNKIKSNPSIEFDIAGNYIFKQFILTDDNANVFMSNKKENESLLEAFDIFLLFKKPIYKKFNIWTGINYGQIDSKLNFSYTENKTEEVDTITKMIINSIKDTTKIYERTMIKSYYDIKESIYNYHMYLRIPVLLSYQGNIKNISYEIRSGVDINIFTYNKGRAITPEGKTTLLKETKSNLQRKQIFGDFHFDLKFDFPFSKNLILSCGPQYKINLNSLMENSAGFKLYQHSLGINAGLKYRF